jgi:hypothetical protein
MTRESKRTLEAIVALLKADRITRREADATSREMRERLAQLLEDMGDAGYEDVDELQATYDTLGACEDALHRAARELPEIYFASDEKDGGDEESAEDIERLAEAAQDIIDEAEAAREWPEDQVDVDTDIVQATIRAIGCNIFDRGDLFDDAFFGFVHGDGPSYYDLDGEALRLADEAMDCLELVPDTPLHRVVDLNGGKLLDAVVAYYEPRILSAWKASEREAAWDEAWGDASEAPVVAEDTVAAAARDWLEEWDAEKKAKDEADAERRKGRDHVMIVDGKHANEISWEHVPSLWTDAGTGRLLQFASDGFEFVASLSARDIEEEGRGDAGTGGCIDVMFRPSPEVYVLKRDHDQEIERLKAEIDMARIAGARAGWDSALQAMDKSRDNYLLASSLGYSPWEWKDRGENDWPGK